MALSVQQIEAAWLDAGGAQQNELVAAAVALAESGGNPVAVSPTGDYGLWQINRVHFPNGDPFPVDWQNVDVNAGYAVAISATGFDWGAWCTCYTNPSECGTIHPLPLPQVDSPAWVQLQRLQSGVPPGTQVTGGLAPAPVDIDTAWAMLQQAIDPNISIILTQINNATATIKGVSG